MSENETFDELDDNPYPFYVYSLADNRNETPEIFYIGIGQNQRMNAHEAEFERLWEAGGDLQKHAKWEHFAQLKTQNRRPLARVIARFKSRAEAIAVEAVAIKWFFGLDRLANAIHGQGSEYIRKKDEWAEVPGLDLEPSVRENTGEEALRNREKLQKAGAYDILDELMKAVKADTSLKAEVRSFDDQLDKPFDPGSGNGWLAFLVRMNGIDFIVSFSSALQFQVAIANTSATRSLHTHIDCTWEGNLHFVNLKVDGLARYGIFSRLPSDWNIRHGTLGWKRGKKRFEKPDQCRAKFETGEGVLRELRLLSDEFGTAR